MKKNLLVLIILSFAFNSSIYANEIKCKFYDVVCKTKKFAADTKQYQKDELRKAAEKRKKK